MEWCTGGSSGVLCQFVFYENVNDNPFLGSVTVQGISYPSLVIAADSGVGFGVSDGQTPFTTISLASKPLFYTGAGTYSVPFTLHGFLEAAVIVPGSQPGSYAWSTLVQDPVTGSGVVTFTMASNPIEGIVGDANFVFSTPEPRTIWFAIVGLVILGLYSRLKEV